MVFADNFSATIFAAKFFSTPLFTSQMGQSPITGMTQLFGFVASHQSLNPRVVCVCVSGDPQANSTLAA
jgi:hypothetical protein